MLRIKSKVYIKFPSTGLGNMLLVWGRGYVFSHENKLELFISTWWGFRWGAWKRRESKKRLYWGYFIEDDLWKRIKSSFYLLNYKVIKDPENNNHDFTKKQVFLFNECETDGDYFKKLKPYRNEVNTALLNILHSSLKHKLESYKKPVIGLHVRRGDFKLGSTITPIEFFIEAIAAIRGVAGKVLPVTVFTDASTSEILPLLSLPQVELAEAKPDILDILLLSKSDICILSISSTFSFWAAFLSNGIILKHPREWHPVIRPEEVNNRYYEGFFDSQNPLDENLIQQLTQLYYNEKY